MCNLVCVLLSSCTSFLIALHYPWILKAPTLPSIWAALVSPFLLSLSFSLPLYLATSPDPVTSQPKGYLFEMDF